MLRSEIGHTCKKEKGTVIKVEKKRRKNIDNWI